MRGSGLCERPEWIVPDRYEARPRAPLIIGHLRSQSAQPILLPPNVRGSAVSLILAHTSGRYRRSVYYDYEKTGKH